MSRLRELASDTLVYGISTVLARFVNYLLVPIHTDVFAPGQYVTVGLVYAAIAFLNVVFSFGMESAYLKFSKDREQAPDVFRTLQMSLAVLATGLLAPLLLFRGELMPLLEVGPEAPEIFLLMLAILWLDTLAIVPFAELRMARRRFTFAFIRILNVAVNVGLNLLLLLQFEMGVEAVFWSNAAASGLTAFMAWLATSPLASGGAFRFGILGQALRFGWPFVLSGFAHTINEMIDRFFLAGMPPDRAAFLYGPDATPEGVAGIYNGVYKMAVFMLLFIQMFRMAWQPFFMRHADAPNAPAWFARAFTGFNLVAGAIFLLVSLFLHEIASLTIPLLGVPLLGEAYRSGLSIVPILLAAYWFHGWYIHVSAGVYIRGNTSAFAWITLAGALITVLSNRLLVPLYGMTGAALTTLFSYLAMALLLLAVAQRAWPVPYRIAPSLLFVGALFAGVWFEGWLETALIAWGWLDAPGSWEWKLGYAGGWMLLLGAGALWWKRMGGGAGAGVGGDEAEEGEDWEWDETGEEEMDEEAADEDGAWDDMQDGEGGGGLEDEADRPESCDDGSV